MAHTTNPLDQPIGLPVDGWSPRARPGPEPMTGRFCRVEPLKVDGHLPQLWAALQHDAEGRNWTYSNDPPPTSRDDFAGRLAGMARSPDPLFHAIVDPATDAAVGWAAFMRIDPANGVIEIGTIHFTELLKRTPAGTEALYLMMRRAFDELGYRRLEWKCDALNQPSRAAALRYGFTFEGIFRQALVYKGRNRDTAWYAILDSEWPAIKAGFEVWLAPENFDGHDQQRASLAACRVSQTEAAP
ncbi:MAG: GNAT family protein [Pseudomonadota bacterium]